MSVPPDRPRSDLSDLSADVLRAVQVDVAAWRTAHPAATFAEIEAAVEPLVARVRAHLIQTALSPVAAAAAPPPRPACPTCGVPMVQRGTHPRTVRIAGDQSLTLHRPYWTCPRCGDGHFPPG
jgi:YgiT-type zinc finger domain-containing protein